jgi:hypothetical protein
MKEFNINNYYSKIPNTTPSPLNLGAEGDVLLMKFTQLNAKYGVKVIKEGIKLLKTSCRKAIERSRSKSGAYKMVRCSFNKPKEFYLSIIRNNTKLFEDWLKQTKIYMDSGRDYRLRPTLDRIDEKGHYYIKNLQVISFSQNASKARKKKS